MVYYRKYRPQKIDDLDSSALRASLQAIFGLKRTSVGTTKAGKSESLSATPIVSVAPHAFLFTGPKGLGKTSTARIVAKIVNCTTPEDKRANGIEPCNICNQCISITNGSNVDILEIDAASNRGIDEIRDLKEKIRLAPVSANRKVYIIDEVHMLTTEAFNALLKTLEEPPPHAMFVLCTTEPHKVPATILSRCFHIAFKLATPEELVRSLKRIVTGESLHVEDDALFAIAKMADGGFRDATKMLEEVALQAGSSKISKELVENTYQTTNIALYIVTIITSLQKKDTKSALEVVKELVMQGIDMKFFIAQIIANLHSKLLKQVGVETEQGAGETITFEVSELQVLFDLFTNAYQETKNAILPQLPLELAIIAYCAEGNRTQMVMGQETTIATQNANGSVSLSSLRKQVGNMAKIRTLYGETASTKPATTPKTEVKSDVDLMHTSPNGEVTKEWQDALWKNIINEMKHFNHTIAGVLRGCVIKKYDTKELIIETGYTFHKEKLDEIKTQQALAKVCKQLTGKDVTVKVELKK